MRLDDMLAHVEKEYHLDFIELIQTGMATSGYMDHIEWCPECKKAISMAAHEHRGIYRCTGMHGSKADEDKYL
jgi:hypothetical protein